MPYDVNLYWSWGRTFKFQEIERFTVDDKNEIDERVRLFIIRMTRSYTFDCGRLDMPLYPCLTGLTITPIGKRESDSVERFDDIVERERKHTERLIRENRFYVDNRIDMTPAPESPAEEAVDRIGK